MRLLPPGEWHGDERGPGAERTFQAPQPELGGAALRRSRGALARQHDAALPVIAQGHGQPDHASVGAGGYMLVVAPGQAPTLLDFFVEAPGRGSDASRRGALIPVRVSFGDAIQTFNIGAASVGTFGMPAGVCEAARRFGQVPLEQLVAPAAALARDGVELNRQQAYVVEILQATITSTAEAAALFAPGGRLLRAGDRLRQPELADALERLGAEGARPFYEGDIGAAIVGWLAERGGLVTAADLRAYEVVHREPLRVPSREREVLARSWPYTPG